MCNTHLHTRIWKHVTKYSISEIETKMLKKNTNNKTKSECVYTVKTIHVNELCVCFFFFYFFSFSLLCISFPFLYASICFGGIYFSITLWSSFMRSMVNFHFVDLLFGILFYFNYNTAFNVCDLNFFVLFALIFSLMRNKCNQRKRSKNYL